MMVSYHPLSLYLSLLWARCPKQFELKYTNYKLLVNVLKSLKNLPLPDRAILLNGPFPVADSADFGRRSA